MPGTMEIHVQGIRLRLNISRCSEETVWRVLGMLRRSPGLSRMYYAVPDLFCDILCDALEDYCGQGVCEKREPVWVKH